MPSQNEKRFYVYTHYDPTIGPEFGIFYVGVGSRKRKSSRLDRSPHWKEFVKDLQKKGADRGITTQIENLTWDDAIRIEVEMIAFYGRMDEDRLPADYYDEDGTKWRNGYPRRVGRLINHTDGGEGAFGLVHTEEVKQRLREARREDIKNKTGAFSPEIHARHSKFMKENSPSKRPEVAGKISKALKGKPKSKKHRESLSKAHTGKTLSPEHRQAISEAQKGKPNVLSEAGRKLLQARMPEHNKLYAHNPVFQEKLRKENSIGIFHTPWGDFLSPRDAVKKVPDQNLNRDLVKDWCSNSDKVISLSSYNRLRKNGSPWIKKEMIGKKRSDYGWGFSPNSEEK